MRNREFLCGRDLAFAAVSCNRAEKPGRALSKACCSGERDDRSCPARKRRAGVRTLRCGCQARHATIYPGIEDSVIDYLQGPLQNCTGLESSIPPRVQPIER